MSETHAEKIRAIHLSLRVAIIQCEARLSAAAAVLDARLDEAQREFEARLRVVIEEDMEP